MIASFKGSFKNRNAARVLPVKVVEELNKTLPQGYEYQQDEYGKYNVVPTRSNISPSFIGEIDYKKNSIPENIPREKLMEYVYRTQKVVECDSVKISDGEKEITLAEMYRDPITGEQNSTVDKMFLYPAPFPEEKPIHFETSDGDSIDINFRRLPCESMNHIRIGNVSFPALKIEFIFPEKEGSKGRQLAAGSINVSATPTKADTVDDAIMSLKILRDFADKSLKINGSSVGKEIGGEKIEINLQELQERIVFWQYFKKLEKALNLHFDPKSDYPEEDQKFANELIHYFINDEEAIYIHPYSHFHLGINGLKKQAKTFDEIIGKPGMSLSFINGPISCTLLGAEFVLFEVNVMVDMTVEKFIMDDDGLGGELYISDSPGVVFTLIKRCYKTRDEAVANMDRIYKKYSKYQKNELPV